MTFAPALRKFAFTTHVTSSVGWLGAVVVFLALAVIGLTSRDEATVRGAYLVMAPASWFVLVPLAHASLLTGIALSLGTTWGLFRHYWVVLKLVITAFATVILLIYVDTFRQMAGVAADPVVELGLVRNPSPMIHAILALILLVIATVLGVYKPFGMTPYGSRKQAGRHHASTAAVFANLFVQSSFRACLRGCTSPLFLPASSCCSCSCTSQVSACTISEYRDWRIRELTPRLANRLPSPIGGYLQSGQQPVDATFVAAAAVVPNRATQAAASPSNLTFIITLLCVDDACPST